MKEITLQLFIPQEVTYQNVMESREKGGRFVVYQYIIPLPLFPPIKKVSKVHYISPSEKPNKYALAYNLLSLFWGWWGLPFGPTYTVSAIQHNKLGTDFSEDVYNHITEHGFKLRTVTLTKLSTVFAHPSNASLKEFKKCFKSFAEKNTAFKSNPIVGKYLDTEHPYYMIGLTGHDYEKRDALKTALYKLFYKNVRFEFLIMSEDIELSKTLKQQGIEIRW